MELAESLLLTNALGALSSIGRLTRLQQDTCVLNATLSQYDLQLVCQGMGCRLYVQDNTSHHPVRLPLSVQTTFYPAMIEAFLPARAFIRSGVFEQEVRFAVEDDCLEAPLVLPPGRCFASIELMLDGKLQRTPYLPLEIDTPIEAD